MMNNTKHIHILGISGTFMSGIALLARQLGFDVTGQDQNCYSPIKDLLIANDISFEEGYENTQMALNADLVLIGNVVSKDWSIVKALIDAKKTMQSGPNWLYENALKHKKVVGVSGTMGKTTTTAMLIHILSEAGFEPGFLVGGVLTDKHTNAQLGQGSLFVIEADEYDSAYFDKKPKFLHYHPDVLIINNIEFDHADIYQDIKAIQSQFRELASDIETHGTVIAPSNDKTIDTVLNMGCKANIKQWSLVDKNSDWFAAVKQSDFSVFDVYQHQKLIGQVQWNLMGIHNIENAMAALTASDALGVHHDVALNALRSFRPVKRRLELKYEVNGISIYDDFAHHPIAIKKTIQALKKSYPDSRIFVMLEFASYTMKKGYHDKLMTGAIANADKVFILKPNLFDIEALASKWHILYEIFLDTDLMAASVSEQVKPGDVVVIMSNRAFGGLDQKIYQNLHESMNGSKTEIG